jgi:predicted ATPase
MELARQVSAGTDFPDGVWLIELAGVQDPEVVASTVASALRLTLPSGLPPTAALAEQLGTRASLLLIDNCEHLLDACSALIDEVLLRCPDINIVATSREPLALPGEFVYRVPSLELPNRCLSPSPKGTDLRVVRGLLQQAVPDRHCIPRSWARPCAHRLQLRHDSGCVPCDVL